MGRVSESYKSLLKQNAMRFLPPELNSVETQRNVLFLVETVIPAVSVCRKSAEEQLWPKVKSGEMSIQDARKKCALYLNRLAGVTIVANLKLERHQKEGLQKAWIAMDSYAQLLKPEESAKLRGLMDEVAAIIEMKETGKRPSAAPAQEMRTVAIDTSKVVIPDMKAAESMKHASLDNKKAEEEEYTGYEEKRKSGTGLIVLLLLVAMAVVGLAMAWKQVRITKVEEAIDAIGTVTMESNGTIKNAEVLYSELKEEQQKQVENYQVLVDSRTEFDRLEKLVFDCIAAIEDIGKVTLESEGKIQKARKAYEALKPDDLTGYVEDYVKILTDAEAKYDQLYVDSIYSRGITLYEQKNYKFALEKFDEIIDNYPKSSRVSGAKSYALKCVLPQAQTCFNSMENEETMILLTNAKKRYGSSDELKDLMEKLEKRLTSTRPISGRKFGSDGIAWGKGTLTITANTKDVLVKVISEENPAKFRLVYVRAGEKTEINLEDGDYKVQYSTGDDWFGEKTGFGKSAVYKEVSRVYSYVTTVEGRTRTYYALKLDLTTAVAATNITYEKFWETAK